jgi:hypothetical protein
MKKFIVIATLLASIHFTTTAQSSKADLTPVVAKLDQAKSVEDFKTVADEFVEIAGSAKEDWLPYYYAAYCNAKIGWLYEKDGDKIEPFAQLSREQLKQALALIDTTKQRKELSELYCVLSMANRAMVFINPMTYGRQYGTKSGNATRLARQLNPDNPRALMIEGWEQYETPKMWGGDKAKAKELLTQAKAKFKNDDRSGVQPHWGEPEADAILKKLN